MKASKKASKKNPPPLTGDPTKAVQRTLRPGALTVNVGHEINEEAHVTPFPSFAPTRRRRWPRIAATSCSTPSRARAPDKSPDRWWTVLFHLRELDSRNDPEACFWRVVAYYRLGELARCARPAQPV